MRSSVLEIIVSNDGLFTLQTRSVIIEDEQSISAINQIAEYIRSNLVAKEFPLISAQNEQESAVNE
jgi:hypothetical protein